MGNAMPTLIVHTTARAMLSSALARSATPTQAMHRMSSAPVTFALPRHSLARPSLSLSVSVDSCLVNNGGCDPSALCSHDPRTNACQCSCKNGYTNTGSMSNVVCTGVFLFFFFFSLPSFCSLQTSVSLTMVVAASTRSVRVTKPRAPSNVSARLATPTRAQLPL